MMKNIQKNIQKKIRFYELVGKDNRKFSPWCWMIKILLYHKNIPFETVEVGFLDIKNIAPGKVKTVPVIEYQGEYITETTDIAKYLDKNILQQNNIFNDQREYHQAVFIKNYCAACLAAPISKLIIFDIYNCVKEKDQQYYRQSREKYFSQSLETLQEQSRKDGNIYKNFIKNIRPVTMTLSKKTFLCGEKPGFTDFQIFGMLQWPLNCSDYIKIENIPKIAKWYENMQQYYNSKIEIG